MSSHKTDMLAAVIQEFDLKTVGYVGDDESFEEHILERLESPVEPGDPADVVYVDEYGEDPVGTIMAAFGKCTEFLMGSQYDHDHIDVMRAVADTFNLACVQVGPCGVWCVKR